MTLDKLKSEIQKHQYIEDTDIIDIALASVISTRLGLGDPVWLVLIGPSSSGKSQILRPLALTDEKFMHRVDDITENTFLSGMKSNDGNNSLLNRIGPKGMIVISDLTVLFSKESESRATILSQFRMIYDGEMVKMSGSSSIPIKWKGHLGIIAGSTPSIYSHFEEVADMGERFIYYRMKDYNAKKASQLALSRPLYGKKLDETLSEIYAEYIKDTVTDTDANIEISEAIRNRIIDISIMAEKIRTSAHMDKWEKTIDRIPVPAMPMRVALQLMGLAKALRVMRKRDLDEKDLSILDWCAYSLANEEKRACLKVLAGLRWNTSLSTQRIADFIGLSTVITRTILQNLSATGVVLRMGNGDSLAWQIKEKDDLDTIRRMENINNYLENTDRSYTSEEKDDASDELDELWHSKV